MDLKIKYSPDEIMKDIRETHDPIKKAILKNFLSIKMNQIRTINDDPSLDNLSETDK